MGAHGRPIVIAGGGLGGLTAALALAANNWRVRVVEHAPAFGAIGYGIQLGPNVFPIFERIGIKDAVLAKSYFPTGIVMADAFTGEDIASIPTGNAFLSRFKNPYVVVHRGDLHGILLDACRSTDGIELQDSTTVTSFDDLADGVRVQFAGGDSVDAAALIGADGLRSAIRSRIVDDGDPSPIGYVAHRTIIPIERVPAHVRSTEVVLWAGPALHIVHYPLRNGEMFNMVAVFRTPTYAGREDLEVYKRELQETYSGTHPVMRTLLELMELDRRWPIFDRRPVRHWASGHTVLLGDAAHPTLQSYAQGAGMAIEDALVLAEALRAGGDIPRRLSDYARGRLVRTARVQLESRLLWEMFHLEDPIEVEVRKEQFESMSDADYFRCLGWLWDGIALPSRQSEPGLAAAG